MVITLSLYLKDSVGGHATRPSVTRPSATPSSPTSPSHKKFILISSARIGRILLAHVNVNASLLQAMRYSHLLQLDDAMPVSSHSAPLCVQRTALELLHSAPPSPPLAWPNQFHCGRDALDEPLTSASG